MHFDGEDFGKLIVRLMASVLILFHVVGKVLHPEAIGGIGGMLASSGWPAFGAYGVYFGEVAGPVVILMGIQSRIGGVLVVTRILLPMGLLGREQIYKRTALLA